MTDGTKFETASTWGKENDTLKLDIDPKSIRMDQITKFWIKAERYNKSLARRKNRYKEYPLCLKLQLFGL